MSIETFLIQFEATNRVLRANVGDITHEESLIAPKPAGNCLNCHKGGQKFDYVCSKDHGCPPIPVTDEMIVGMQGKDARCPAKAQ